MKCTTVVKFDPKLPSFGRGAVLYCVYGMPYAAVVLTASIVLSLAPPVFTELALERLGATPVWRVLTSPKVCLFSVLDA